MFCSNEISIIIFVFFFSLDNEHLVNLKLHQTPQLIDDSFVFIRRYANSSQLIENSHKLVTRLEKCFYHNENSALDLCDEENVVSCINYAKEKLENFHNKLFIVARRFSS